MSHYRKSLNLSTAIVTTEYELDGAHYRREVFASYPDRAIVVRLTADQPEKISATLRLTTPHTPTTTFEADGNTLLMRGQGPGEAFRRDLQERVQSEGYKYPAFFEQSTNGVYQMKERIKDSSNILYGDEVAGRGTTFAALLRTQTDGGTVRAEGDALRVEGADSLTLILCADTSFNGQHKSPSREGRDPVSSVRSLQKKNRYDGLRLAAPTAY